MPEKPSVTKVTEKVTVKDGKVDKQRKVEKDGKVVEDSQEAPRDTRDSPAAPPD